MTFDLLAEIIGYSVMGAGAIAAFFYVFWWLVGKVMKQLGYWPTFVKVLFRMAKERHEKKSKP